MYVREALNARRPNRYGFGDSRIADSVSQVAMHNFIATNHASLRRALTQGNPSSPTAWDPGTWAAGAVGSMADAITGVINSFGSPPPAASATYGAGSFEPQAPQDVVPPWVYWAGAGAAVVLIGAVVYKKRRG